MRESNLKRKCHLVNAGTFTHLLNDVIMAKDPGPRQFNLKVNVTKVSIYAIAVKTLYNKCVKKNKNMSSFVGESIIYPIGKEKLCRERFPLW